MNAKEIKAAILWWMLYKLHFMAAVTEYGGVGTMGNADLFGILDSGYTVEFEVKCAKADLAGELKSIKLLTDEVEREKGRDWIQKAGSYAKLDKHARYLNRIPPGEMPWGHREATFEMVPNRFYFAVTPELVAYATESLKGTPYGLYSVSEAGTECVKRADLLHKNRAGEEIRNKILHKACTELETVRGELAKGLRCTACRKEKLATRCPACDEKMKREAEHKKKSNACWAEVGKLPSGEQWPAYNECMKQSAS